MKISKHRQQYLRDKKLMQKQSVYRAPKVRRRKIRLKAASHRDRIGRGFDKTAVDGFGDGGNGGVVEVSGEGTDNKTQDIIHWVNSLFVYFWILKFVQKLFEKWESRKLEFADGFLGKQNYKSIIKSKKPHNSLGILLTV